MLGWVGDAGFFFFSRSGSLQKTINIFSFQDYHDHIAEISAKLVAIMDSLFDKLLSKVMIDE